VRYVGVTSDYQERLDAHTAGAEAAFTRVHGVKASRVIQEVSNMEAAKAVERTVTEALRRVPGLRVAGARRSRSTSFTVPTAASSPRVRAAGPGGPPRPTTRDTARLNCLIGVRWW